MKKTFLLSICLILAMSFLTLGCTKEDEPTAKAKILKIATSADFPPFEFQDEKGQEYVGFDMDIIRAVAKEMGYEAQITSVNFDGLIPALEAKNVDVIIAGISINDERSKKVLFSLPYYTSGLTIVVKKDNTAINSFFDLHGKTVAVQLGTTSAMEVKKMNDVKVKEFTTSTDTFLELKNGGVDAVVNDRPVNDRYIVEHNDTNVRVLSDLLTSEDYGIACNKTNTKLKEKIDEALTNIKKNGEYDKIYNKWFALNQK